MKSLLTFGAVVIALSMESRARPQDPVDPEQTVVHSVAGEHDCTREDYKFAFSREVERALNAHSTMHLPTAKCRAVSLSCLPGSRIVKMTGWQMTDVFVSATVIRASAKSGVRVIIATGGLSVPDDPEDDPKNKAVFNELLSTAPLPQTQDKMANLAELYMFMVGHSPDETPQKLSDLLKVNDFDSMVSTDAQRPTVMLHQRMSLFGRPPQREWKLEFQTDGKRLRLISVKPESDASAAYLGLEQNRITKQRLFSGEWMVRGYGDWIGATT